MSILTSRTEVDEARIKLAGLAVEQLERDAVFWLTAKTDHRLAFEAASRTVTEARERYLEADAWADLVADELALRRRVERAL